jgi:hypothetical protein
MGTQCIVTAFLGTLLFYLLGALANGFVINFEITFKLLVALSPIFIIGFLLPFSRKEIATSLNRLWKK